MKYLWMFFGGALLFVIAYVVFVREEGEFKSPQDNQTFTDTDLQIDYVYGRPSKRDRLIFGGLVPYDKIWRTGANEATEFHTNKDLDFSGKELKAGDYSMWAQPGKDTWKLYFNSKIPDWGINEDGIPSRDAQNDVLVIDTPSTATDNVTEMFTIAVQKADSTYYLVFNWDKTKAAFPFSRK
jgi:Protein of unknown function (DUF2911)